MLVGVGDEVFLGMGGRLFALAKGGVARFATGHPCWDFPFPNILQSDGRGKIPQGRGKSSTALQATWCPSRLSAEPFVV